MRRTLLAALAPCLAAAAVLASPRAARAGIFLGAEIDGEEGTNLPGGARAGLGFLGTFGYRIHLGPVFLQPEARAGYLAFPDAAVGDLAHVASALGGLRFGLLGRIQPSIFGHVGVGWLDSDADGPAFDAGLALGFKLIPLLSFGAQAAYNVVTLTSGEPAPRWVSFGLHLAVEL
jgi:hypothetical protein